jgi:hypothetical protein
MDPPQGANKQPKFDWLKTHVTPDDEDEEDEEDVDPEDVAPLLVPPSPPPLLLLLAPELLVVDPELAPPSEPLPEVLLSLPTHPACSVVRPTTTTVASIGNLAAQRARSPNRRIRPPYRAPYSDPGWDVHIISKGHAPGC